MSTVHFAPAPATSVPAPSLPESALDSEPTASIALAPIHIPVGAWVAVAVVLLYIAWAFAGVNIAPTAWNYLHEFFHDGRHFLGIPCH